MDVIIESERDRRTLEWLIGQVGQEAVEEACARLEGSRKPYVSNLAKVLGLRPPKSLEGPSREEAVRRLTVLRQMFPSKKA